MGEPFVGVQLGSHSIYDEGVDHALDLLQRTAGINALLVYSHTYQRFARGRPSAGMADHGVPVRDPSARRLTHAWVPANEQYYGGTMLRHVRNPDEEYADRDVLADLVEPARRRGMQLFARILEGHGPDLAAHIPNWPKVLTVDVYGRRNHLPCWNNPDYRAWWLGTVEDLFKSYPLDGFMYGAERSGPLPRLLASGAVPVCFCEHCWADGQRRGIDVERARSGFQALHELISGWLDDGAAPVDGYFVTVWRVLLKYPEILAWEYAWHQSKEGLAREMYGAIKAIKPSAQVGWHVYHPVTWEPIYRAEMDYAEMRHYSDWIKPVVYHDIAGVRIRNRHVLPLGKTLWGDLPPEEGLRLTYRLMGYDPDREAGLDELPTTGMSPEYVYRETKRCVEATKGQVPVYAGVGFDVPTDGNPMRSQPDRVYQATRRAFDAGAKGLVVSREYDEMRVENLEAVGRAIKDAATAG